MYLITGNREWRPAGERQASARQFLAQSLEVWDANVWAATDWAGGVVLHCCFLRRELVVIPTQAEN